MKNIIIFFFIFVPLLGSAQIISTFAGNGVAGNSGDGNQAIDATIDYPSGGVFDSIGNYYFGTGINGNTIRKIDTDGVISTIAGTGTAGFSGDNNLATSAQLSDVNALAIDAIGNLYISDAQNYRIRKISIATGIITTIAGNGTMGYGGDGNVASQSTIGGTNGLCFDNKGNLYISDASNFRIRKIDIFGIIATIAGTGSPGTSGDNGAAINAQIANVGGICIDSHNNLYLSDRGAAKIRKIDTNGIITAIGGTGEVGYSGDGGPAVNAQFNFPMELASDSHGNIYIPDLYNYRIRKIDTAGIVTTVAGTGIAGYNGDGISATSAELNYQQVVTIDKCDNIYIADIGNYRIRKVTFNTNCLEATNTQNINNLSLDIYPNPVSEQVNIQSPTLINNVIIINFLGQVVYHQTYNAKKVEVNIALLPKGVYFVKVNEQYVQKLLKE